MKPKINIDREKPSSEEIHSHKDFNSVLKQFNSTGGSAQVGASGKPLWKSTGFLVAAAVVVISAVSVLVYQGSHTAATVSAPVTDVKQLSPAEKDKTGKESLTSSASLPRMHITPPIKGMDIPFQNYAVDASKGGEFQTKQGTHIHVPKNAFGDEKGNAVKGNIELRFREFHDPVDFFLCGIPMSYDSAGVRYQFESAGMVELLGFREGKPVYILPGKKVDIEIDSKRTGGTEFNVYRFDTANCNWVYLGKDKTMKSRNAGTGVTDSVQTSPTQARQEASPEEKALDRQAEEVKETADKKVVQLPALPAEPVKPNKMKASKHSFDVHFDEKEFPEMKQYAGAKWEVGEENTSFDEHVAYGTQWEDIGISEGPRKGINYKITLKKGLTTQTYIVYPVFEGKAFDKAMADFNAVYEKYSAVHNSRMEKEKVIRTEEEAQLTELKKKREALERKYEAQQQVMRQKEETKLNAHMSAMDNSDKLMSTFSVSGFGVFNCDRPDVYPHGISAHIRLQDENGKTLHSEKVYLMDKSKNGLFSWYESDIKDFSFDPQATNTLFTVVDNRIYCLRNDDFVLIKSGVAVDVKLKPVKQEFKSADEIRAYMGI